MKENVLRIVVFSLVILAFLVVLDGMFTGYVISFQGADGPTPTLLGDSTANADLHMALLVVSVILIVAVVILAFRVTSKRKPAKTVPKKAKNEKGEGNK